MITITQLESTTEILHGVVVEGVTNMANFREAKSI